MPSSLAAHRVPPPLAERDAHKDSAGDSAPPAATGVPDLAAFTTWEQHADGRRFGVSHFRLSGIYCAACSSTIEFALTRVVGVADARVNAGTQRAWVRWDGALASPAQLVEAIERAGYGAAPDAAGSARVLRLRAQRRALWRLFVGVFCMMQVMMYSTPLYVAEPGSLAPDLQRLLQWASWLLSVPVLLFSAGPFFTEAWRSLRMRRIGMDMPVALGIGVMFAVSSGATFDPGGLFGHEVYFDSLTMFVSFLLGGRYLELKARDRVAASLEGAVSRLPMLARRLAGSGAAQMVAQAELRVGDRLRVLRGEAFPADGSLVDGATEADEALLTGESAPVLKAWGDAVLAGSLNLAAPVSM